MLISKASIYGYKSLKQVNLEFNRLVIFIGENNSGKSNLLRAITLPFVNNEIGVVNKNLGWHEINNDLKREYFNFIEANIDRIKNEELSVEKFQKHIPYVSVKVTFTPEGHDTYFVHKWVSSTEPNISYEIEYRYYITNPQELLQHVKQILATKTAEEIKNIQMNLLPIEMYQYSINIPSINEPVAFNDLLNFKYDSLSAERDDFSNKAQLGSQALVKLLHNKLGNEQKVKVEESYGTFFNELKTVSELDNVFNWQETSDIENAKDFFSKITLMPNMPSISSLLNNVKLGIGDEYLHTQGLGYRNLVYLLVMINSLEINKDIALNILTLEEPEAHLCINNERLLASFINNIISKTSKTQLFLSTHSSEFLNKLELENVTVVKEGQAFSLKSVAEQKDLNYLSKKFNLDFLKFLYSRKCILVEGPSEEMLIKSYLHHQQNSLSDIEVLCIHKGFTTMLDIWLKVNSDTSHRIGIIRDFDNQPKAKKRHEKYNDYANILVTTTTEYTLEPEFVKTEGNYSKLEAYFKEVHGWTDIETSDKLSDKWRTAKTDTMLRFCQDIGTDYLKDIDLPKHIAAVLKFLQSGVKE
ncbi:ATP-dependent nuclease [Solibacillus cecembensis]|uniref:ATP-dependent nuclease n=1 Tax=Solibacillus cecembensis TaxID=459347 RepID=UPI003D027EC8